MKEIYKFKTGCIYFSSKLTQNLLSVETGKYCIQVNHGKVSVLFGGKCDKLCCKGFTTSPHGSQPGLIYFLKTFF
jgi:hypothetical protein